VEIIANFEDFETSLKFKFNHQFVCSEYFQNLSKYSVN